MLLKRIQFIIMLFVMISTISFCMEEGDNHIGSTPQHSSEKVEKNEIKTCEACSQIMQISNYYCQRKYDKGFDNLFSLIKSENANAKSVMNHIYSGVKKLLFEEFRSLKSNSFPLSNISFLDALYLCQWFGNQLLMPHIDPIKLEIIGYAYKRSIPRLADQNHQDIYKSQMIWFFVISSVNGNQSSFNQLMHSIREQRTKAIFCTLMFNLWEAGDGDAIDFFLKLCDQERYQHGTNSLFDYVVKVAQESFKTQTNLEQLKLLDSVIANDYLNLWNLIRI